MYHYQFLSKGVMMQGACLATVQVTGHSQRQEQGPLTCSSDSAMLRQHSTSCITSSDLSCFITYRSAIHIQQNILANIDHIGHYFIFHMILCMKTLMCWKSWPKTRKPFSHLSLPCQNVARHWKASVFHTCCKQMLLFT